MEIMTGSYLYVVKHHYIMSPLEVGLLKIMTKLVLLAKLVW